MIIGEINKSVDKIIFINHLITQFSDISETSLFFYSCKKCLTQTTRICYENPPTLLFSGSLEAAMSSCI
jgi:hypothetical protein